ncbi:MAG: helix-turn-helix domain-containing protein, partial [Ignavibacteria bacterium]|nr:helix-turn-helix domain-containing protein [Ignavibacteria bacterium]
MTVTTQTVLPSARTMYRALIERDKEFEGVFIAAVRTTGIFCRPTCPARKPEAGNVEFFPTPHEALLSGYRPCRRCRPLEPPGTTPAWIRSLISRIDAQPGERVRDDDLRALGLEPARVRRWFKQELGVTFQGYQRAVRLGSAMGRLKLGENLSQVAFDHGYESLSGFRDAFQRLFGSPPGNGTATSLVTVNRILTPLGPMLAGVTDRGLCLLEFMDRRMIETQMKRLLKRLHCSFVPGNHPMLNSVSAQLSEYFAGK